MAVPLQHTTGPVIAFINGALLGTCERSPYVEGHQWWHPTFNDLAGPLVPFDKQYMGETKLIVLDLNYFDHTVLNAITIFGIDFFTARGRYLNQNGERFQLGLQFSYFGTINATPGLPAGESYPGCNLLTAYYDPLGTATRKVRLIIESNPIFDPTTGAFRTYFGG